MSHATNLYLFSEDEWAFDLLYCVAFVVLDKQWLEKNASYMDFNVLLFSPIFMSYCTSCFFSVPQLTCMVLFNYWIEPLNFFLKLLNFILKPQCTCSITTGPNKNKKRKRRLGYYLPGHILLQLFDSVCHILVNTLVWEANQHVNW